MRVKMQPDGTCEELDHNRNFVYCFSMDISCVSSNKKEGHQLKALHEKSFSCGDHVVLLISCSFSESINSECQICAEPLVGIVRCELVLICLGNVNALIVGNAKQEFHMHFLRYLN